MFCILHFPLLLPSVKWEQERIQVKRGWTLSLRKIERTGKEMKWYFHVHHLFVIHIRFGIITSSSYSLLAIRFGRFSTSPFSIVLYENESEFNYSIQLWCPCHQHTTILSRFMFKFQPYVIGIVILKLWFTFLTMTHVKCVGAF